MRKTNKHHVWYPRRAYRSGLAKQFRNLPCMVVRMDIEAHNMLHFLQEPPTKPSVSLMKRMIARHKARECGCYGAR